MSLVKHSQRTVRKPCKHCGSSELYWAHDTDKPNGQECPQCNGANGSFVLIEKSGLRHECRKGKVETKADVTDAEVEDRLKALHERATDFFTPPPKKEEPVSILAAEPKAKQSTPDAAQALEALQALLSPKIDRAEVERICREVVNGVVYPTKTVVIKDGVKREVKGNTHAQLADVTTAVMAGEHVMMVGPAGTGKSTIAEQAAESLGLASYSISLSPQTPASQIIGYMQAQGEYVRTLFREAYENGGLFHFDEVDNAHPSVLAVINAALANGHMAFPDQMVKRHDDFRVVASANTYGRGATRAYVGRQAIDAATLDRFTMITIEIDEALESALVAATGVETSLQRRILGTVRKMRKNADKHGLNVVVSPRASVGMGRLLAAGMNWEAASDARLKRGLDESTWNKLNG
jgi:cobaltochelatase CobS